MKQVYILEELAKEAMERVRCSEECSKVMERVECSEERSEEVIERVGCGKGCSDSDDGHISWSDYLEILVFK